ncbi:MAG: ester cyclase [Solirubrobacterales bacterium]
MNSQEIEAVVNGYAAAKNAHDVERALEFCCEDCVYENMGTGGVRVEGKSNVAEFFAGFFTAFPNWSGSVDGQAIGEDTMALWGRMRGTNAGEFMGANAPGRTFDVPVVFVISLRDGQIASEQAYFDLATLAEQIDVPLSAIRLPDPATPV